jgi:hypothetical protein
VTARNRRRRFGRKKSQKAQKIKPPNSPVFSLRSVRSFAAKGIGIGVGVLAAKNAKGAKMNKPEDGIFNHETHGIHESRKQDRGISFRVFGVVRG